MMSLLRNKKILTQLFLYGITGGVLNLLGFGVYVAITWFGVEPKLTMTFLYSLGALISFFVNKNLVFGAQYTGYGVFVKFILAHIGGYIVNFLLLYYFYSSIGYPHILVQLAAIFIVALYLFIAFKFFVFKKPSSILERSI